jgi:ACR3 family arsenite transporter
MGGNLYFIWHVTRIFFPSLSTFLSEIEFANVSLPIAVVLLMMMYPIMLKVKYSELLNFRKNAR